MHVDKIIEYKSKEGKYTAKVILQPTADYPHGSYFYIDAEDIDILVANNGNYHLQARVGMPLVLHSSSVPLVEQISNKHLGSGNYIFRYENYCKFDLVDKNLDLEKTGEVVQRGTTEGFGYSKRLRAFIVETTEDGIRRQKVASPENNACKLRYSLENKNYTIPYNFMKDRSRCIDLLHLERAGVISDDETNFLLLKRIQDNPWYVYRYGLSEEFKKYGLKIPKFSLDSEKYMTHPITGQRFNPYIGEYKIQEVTVKDMASLVKADINLAKSYLSYL
jgi:hypothetical protein